MILNSFLLAIAAMIWGAGFIATKWTLLDYGAYWSNGFRFILATIIISPYLIYKFKKRPLDFYKWPMLAGLILYLSMQAQTIGLETTTAAKSGFITTFYAFFTPIILMVFKRYRYQKTFWSLLFMSLMGVACLCDLHFASLVIGDMWTLTCAILFSLHILIADKIANNYDPIEFNGIQNLFVALFSIAPAFYFEGTPTLPMVSMTHLLTPSSLSGFIILALFSSNIAFSIQVYAQKTIPAHIVGLIFLLESLFATLFGYLFLNEKLTLLNIFGCVLILFSIGLIPKFGRLRSKK